MKPTGLKIYRRIILAALSLFLLPFLGFFAGCAKKVAEVGTIPITGKDIALRARVSEVYYPGSGKDYIGLTQLVKGYLSEEVLKSLGQKVDQSTWEAEANRIDQNTKAPAVLEKIKNIYGRDRKNYLNSFIRVVYADRAVYNEVFLKSGDIHKQQRNKADDFLKEALKSPSAFSETAKTKGLEAKKLKLSEQEGIQPLEAGTRPRENTPGAGQEQAKRLIDAISSLKPGAVTPRVIEWQEGYQIIKLIKHVGPVSQKSRKNEGEYYLVESVSVPKRNFDDWFWELASGIPVRIYDPKLKDELLKNVGWAKNLKLK
ncbi:MAG: hypothetical protein NT056_01975 [Proteobacteria bacterium]|nr:hypothetical protein [Pseudomonadota bacterium]